MPRRRIELSDFYPYHVCARSNNRNWFELPLRQVFGIYANKMEDTVERYGIECHSFVLMANHFHMLVSTPNANLSLAMRYFMTETSRAIARASKRINRIYGARYHWAIIRTSEHFAHAYYYIYRNPIHHKAVERVEDYLWSTLSSNHRKFSRLVVSRNDGFKGHLPDTRRELVKWLNRSWSDLYTWSIGNALKRHEFLFPQCRITGKRCTFNDMLHPQNTPGTFQMPSSAEMKCRFVDRRSQ